MATVVVTPTPAFGRVTIVSESATAGLETGPPRVSISSDLISAVVSSSSKSVTIAGGSSVVVSSVIGSPRIAVVYGAMGPQGPAGATGATGATGPTGPAGPAGGESVPYAMRVDEVSGGVTYIGEADPGEAGSDASWRIKRLTETGPDIVIAWADGNANFDNVWDDRLGLTYS